MNKTRKDNARMKNQTLKKRKVSKKPTFTWENYSSGDGMLTSVWGPSLWHFLHTMSFNYPIHPTKDEKRHYRNFILSLKYVLPCKYCRDNLRSNFRSLPLTMSSMKSRDTFSKYIYDLHEVINKMLKKKSGLSYDNIRERYEHFRARCGKNTTKKKRQTKMKRKVKQMTTKKIYLHGKHKGCTEPLHKVKSKGVIKIVPINEKSSSIQIDKKCQEMV